MVNHCKCGCGSIIPDKDKRGRPRSFVMGHINNIRIYKPVSKISIEKRRRTLKEKYPNGKPAWNRGIKCPKEVREKISKKHLGKKLSKETKNKIGDAHRGEKNYNWKGGIYDDKKGYVWIKTKIPELNTYHKKYAKRANVIWYENTGEIIKYPYFLHHKNENKKDDSYKNLVKTTRREHFFTHHKK